MWDFFTFLIKALFFLAAIGFVVLVLFFAGFLA